MQRILPGKNVNPLWRALSNCILVTLLRKLDFLKKVGVSTELRNVVYVDAGRDRGAPPRTVRTTNKKLEIQIMEESLKENAPVS